MALRDDQKFSERMNTAAKARAEMLAKVKARAEAGKVGSDERAKERAAIAKARDERLAQRAEEKARLAAEAETLRVAEEEARKTAAEEAKVAAAKTKEDELQKMMVLLEEQKSARDARYAARKDRQKKGRR
jgi:hypothetical protein